MVAASFQKIWLDISRRCAWCTYRRFGASSLHGKLLVVCKKADRSLCPGQCCFAEEPCTALCYNAF